MAKLKLIRDIYGKEYIKTLNNSGGGYLISVLGTRGGQYINRKF